MHAAARHTQHVSCLLAIEPSGFPTSFESLRDIPVIIAQGDHLDATPLWQTLSARWSELVDSVNALKGRATLVDLAERWPGATHMPMMDRNSAEMLDDLLQSF